MSVVSIWFSVELLSIDDSFQVLFGFIFFLKLLGATFSVVIQLVNALVMLRMLQQMREPLLSQRTSPLQPHSLSQSPGCHTASVHGNLFQFL